MTTSKTIWFCDICGNKYDTEKDAIRCETQVNPPKPEIPIGSLVKLDARGHKDGNMYVEAVITKYSLVSDYSYGTHKYVMTLDRYVRLHECWGEGGDDDTFRNMISVDFILPDDLSKAEEDTWYGNNKGKPWLNETEKYSRKNW